MTVWIYVNTSKQVGDVDHIRVFATVDAARRKWFEENDPAGVAFEYEVLEVAGYALPPSWASIAARRPRGRPRQNRRRPCRRSSIRPVPLRRSRTGSSIARGLDRLEAELRISHPDLAWSDEMQSLKAEADAAIGALIP